MSNISTQRKVAPPKRALPPALIRAAGLLKGKLRGGSLPYVLSREQKVDAAKRTFGAWKHRSLKKDLNTLAKIRRGWNRRLP